MLTILYPRTPSTPIQPLTIILKYLQSQKGFESAAREKSFSEDFIYGNNKLKKLNKLKNDDDDVVDVNDEDVANPFPVLGNNQWTPIFPAEVS